MLNPLLVSRLMRDVSNLWFCYVLLVEVSGLTLVFCSLLAFNRCYLNKRYGKLHGDGVNTIDIVVEAEHQMLDTKCERTSASATVDTSSL
ncbi:hypothetical protein ElyMa_006990000 [Elysia marginata]|uniref:Uncharacterized protein n=1 Tax=Elysia marginata TaxID=1093978 RepID=A0AAV4JRE1_9GAST|nr:hypothetical protein ElyMa_006990000 [Elysia marginata]